MTIIRISWDACIHLDLQANPSRNVYICLCHGVTDRDIQRAAAEGCRDVSELTMRTGCGATCGSCLLVAEAILDEAHGTTLLPLQLYCEAA